jgi:hypothetical protein
VKLTGYQVKYFDEAPGRGYGLRDFLASGMAALDKAKFEKWMKEGFEMLVEVGG